MEDEEQVESIARILVLDSDDGWASSLAPCSAQAIVRLNNASANRGTGTTSRGTGNADLDAFNAWAGAE